MAEPPTNKGSSSSHEMPPIARRGSTAASARGRCTSMARKSVLMEESDEDEDEAAWCDLSKAQRSWRLVLVCLGTCVYVDACVCIDREINLLIDLSTSRVSAFCRRILESTLTSTIWTRFVGRTTSSSIGALRHGAGRHRCP